MAVALNPLTPVNEGPTSVYSDCRRCARRATGARRTREASAGWPINGKALLGGKVAHDGGRPSAANVVNPCGYRSETGCAAYDGRGALSRCGVGQALPCRDRSSTKLEMRKTGGRSRGGWGVPGGPGGGRPEDLRPGVRAVFGESFGKGMLLSRRTREGSKRSRFRVPSRLTGPDLERDDGYSRCDCHSSGCYIPGRRRGRGKRAPFTRARPAPPRDTPINRGGLNRHAARRKSFASRGRSCNLPSGSARPNRIRSGGT